jgi:hypothetical protein
MDKVRKPNMSVQLRTVSETHNLNSIQKLDDLDVKGNLEDPGVDENI